MGFFDKLLNKLGKQDLQPVDVDDDTIVALADGEVIDVKSVPDPMFAEEMMGKTIAFKYDADKVVLCAPANGVLAVLFPTGHAFGLQCNNGLELLVHCGVDTVNTRGDGFRLLDKKQGDTVKAGDPIVEVDIKKLSKNYDMSTMLIITRNDDEKPVEFLGPQHVQRGQKVN